MSSKHKHEKKTNVINRTTSETLRLGELPQSASSSLSIQSLPQTRKKIQNSSSSFQITGVSMTRLDFGDDSADDLDESHTDDISRVTDNETPSFSEDSRDTDEPPSGPAVQLLPPPEPPVEEAGARFKVVKVPSAAPFSRGRWTCFDYLDNSEHNLNYIYTEQKVFRQFDNQRARSPPQAAQACISPHYTAVQLSTVANKPVDSTKAFPQGYSSILCEGVQASDGIKYENTQFLRHEFINEQNQKAATQPSNVNGQKDDILSDIKVALTSTPASNSGLF